jgi:hypothetical protein
VFCAEVPANTVYIKDGVVDAASSRLVTAWFIVGAQYKDKQYWTPARDFCKTQVSSDSDLASPLLEADNNNLAKELTKALGAGSDAAWIGLTTEKFSNTKSDWFFLATRKTPAYSAWDTGYPFMLAPPVGSTGLPQACGMLYAAGDAGRWQNGVCAGYVRAFVCQLMY